MFSLNVCFIFEYVDLFISAQNYTDVKKLKFSIFSSLQVTQLPLGKANNGCKPPSAPENCPPGLEYLTQVDQLLIKQQVELLEGI